MASDSLMESHRQYLMKNAIGFDQRADLLDWRYGTQCVTGDRNPGTQNDLNESAATPVILINGQV